MKGEQRQAKRVKSKLTNKQVKESGRKELRIPVKNKTGNPERRRIQKRNARKVIENSPSRRKENERDSAVMLLSCYNTDDILYIYFSYNVWLARFEITGKSRKKKIQKLFVHLIKRLGDPLECCACLLLTLSPRVFL